MNSTRLLKQCRPAFLKRPLLAILAALLGTSAARLEAAIAPRGSATTGTTTGTSLTIVRPTEVVAGDGIINSLDYNILKDGWYKAGDAE
jgi:hypothetical protein